MSPYTSIQLLETVPLLETHAHCMRPFVHGGSTAWQVQLMCVHSKDLGRKYPCVVYLHASFVIVEDKSLVETFYIAAVWCFMTFKWSMVLLSNAITDDRNPNVGLPQVEEESGGSSESLLPDVNAESP